MTTAKDIEELYTTEHDAYIVNLAVLKELGIGAALLLALYMDFTLNKALPDGWFLCPNKKAGLLMGFPTTAMVGRSKKTLQKIGILKTKRKGIYELLYVDIMKMKQLIDKK